MADAGLTGYYCKQVTGDSGSGATVGDFEAKTVGLGPCCPTPTNGTPTT